MSSVFNQVNLFNFVNHTPVQTKSQVEYQKKFIEKATDVHGGKYDYSKVVYKKAKEKIKIICPIHGEFEQIPSKHMSGCGCPKCGRIMSNTKRQSTTEEFIKKAKKIHGDKFDYSKVIYKTALKKVIIICQEHGEFEQIPQNHLCGRGCAKCNFSKHTSNSEEFIKKAKLIHGDKYDYSKVVYKYALEKVIIICKKHGEFTQTPANHLNDHGCPVCGIENANYITGIYYPVFPEKYDGNINGIIYRSSYELKAFDMVDKNSTITSWGSETIRIPYTVKNKKYTYIVDLKLETKDKTTLVEIKPKSKVNFPKYKYDIPEWNKNQAKWKAAREYCLKRGWDFKIWTEKELNI